MDVNERIAKSAEPIRMAVADEEELYNPLDPQGTTLSDAAASYLSQGLDLELYTGKHAQQSGLMAHVELECDAPVDAERFRSALRRHFDGKIRECDREVADNRKQEAGLLVFTIVLYVASILCAAQDWSIASTILAAVGGFTSFQLCDFALFRDRKAALEKRAWGYLKGIEITMATKGSS